MSIYIFGDSLTRGHFGIGYVKYLDSSFIHKGWDGATLQQIIPFSTHHLKKVEEAHTSVVFQGGANDALYTYLSNHSNGWTEYAKNNSKGKHPSISEWKKGITLKITSLQEKHPSFSFSMCNIAVEALFAREELYAITLEYNEAIKSITSELSLSLIDLFSCYEEVLHDKKVNDYMPKDSDSIEKDAILIGGSEEKAKELSHSRSLLLTTDGIHPNKDGARCIAKTLQSRLFI